jgi:hypothetical protein
VSFVHLRVLLPAWRMQWPVMRVPPSVGSLKGAVTCEEGTATCEEGTATCGRVPLTVEGCHWLQKGAAACIEVLLSFVGLIPMAYVVYALSISAIGFSC